MGRMCYNLTGLAQTSGSSSYLYKPRFVCIPCGLFIFSILLHDKVV
jgi:hypothetical protein